MKTNIYRCDICGKYEGGYYGYNSNVGYCDNPECKEKADDKNMEFMREFIDVGDFENAMDCL